MPIPVIYITSLMLLIGAAPLPYGYYMLLRIVVTGVFFWAAFISYERKHEALPWLFVLGAILFNPLIMIHLPKELWAIVDVVAAIFLFANRKCIQKQH